MLQNICKDYEIDPMYKIITVPLNILSSADLTEKV